MLPTPSLAQPVRVYKPASVIHHAFYWLMHRRYASLFDNTPRCPHRSLPDLLDSPVGIGLYGMLASASVFPSLDIYTVIVMHTCLHATPHPITLTFRILCLHFTYTQHILAYIREAFKGVLVIGVFFLVLLSLVQSTKDIHRTLGFLYCVLCCMV